MAGDAGIAIIAIAVLYLMSMKKSDIVNGGGGYTLPPGGNGTLSEDQEAPLNIPLIRRDLTRTYTFVSKKTGLISPGMYTRPAHMYPGAAKRAGIWIE